LEIFEAEVNVGIELTDLDKNGLKAGEMAVSIMEEA
jgi:hypothetical protein